MRAIPNRRWDVTNEKADEIKKLLLLEGGEEREVNNINESWRIRLSDATITYYNKGTLYITDSDDPDIIKVHDMIDSIAGSRFITSTKEYLIGFDEAGKGEILGPIILAGVLIPSNLFKELEKDLGIFDTKVKHDISYWDNIFRKIELYKEKGLRFIIKDISPEEVDKYNINSLLDTTYSRMLTDLMRDIPSNNLRIVIDDYGIGISLKKYLERLDAEVVCAKKADDNYLEVKIASLIAKIERERIIDVIAKDPEFKINDIDIGSGNANDPKTIRWLKEWKKVKGEWPWFVRRSYKTVREIDDSKITID